MNEETYDYSKEIYDLKNMSIDEIEDEIERLSRPKFISTKSDLQNLYETLPFKAVPKMDYEDTISHYIKFVFEPGNDRIDNIVYSFKENGDDTITLTTDTEIRLFLSDPNLATGLYEKIKYDYFPNGEEEKSDTKWKIRGGGGSWIFVDIKDGNGTTGDKPVYNFLIILGNQIR